MTERALPAGEPCCISTARTLGSRRFRRADRSGTRRSIAVALMLAMIGEGMRGGAFSGTSHPYPTPFVVPLVEREQVRWRLGTKGVAPTADVVRDLFLSVPNDDPQATERLAPLAAYARGQGPTLLQPSSPAS